MRCRWAINNTFRGFCRSTSNADKYVLPVPVAETSNARGSSRSCNTLRASRAFSCILFGTIFRAATSSVAPVDGINALLFSAAFSAESLNALVERLTTGELLCCRKKFSYSDTHAFVSGVDSGSSHSFSYCSFASSSIFPSGKDLNRMFHSLLHVSAFCVRFELPMMMVEICSLLKKYPFA